MPDADGWYGVDEEDEATVERIYRGQNALDECAGTGRPYVAHRPIRPRVDYQPSGHDLNGADAKERASDHAAKPYSREDKRVHGLIFAAQAGPWEGVCRGLFRVKPWSGHLHPVLASKRWHPSLPASGNQRAAVLARPRRSDDFNPDLGLRHAVLILRRVAEVILDNGPISHAEIERYDDPGVDAAVEDYCQDHGRSLDSATYRLLLIETSRILETRWFAKSTMTSRPDLIDALQHEKRIPPIIVYRATDNPDVFGLLDGVNRTFAHWSLGISTIRAYEILMD